MWSFLDFEQHFGALDGVGRLRLALPSQRGEAKLDFHRAARPEDI